MYDLSDTGSVKSYGSYGSVSSLAMAQSGAPELLVSLCYQSLTGRLTVEVLKASNLRNVSMQRAPGINNLILLAYVLTCYISRRYFEKKITNKQANKQKDKQTNRQTHTNYSVILASSFLFL